MGQRKVGLDVVRRYRRTPGLSRTTSEVGVRVTFKVADTLTVRPQMAGRPFEEQPHELYRK